VKPYQPTGYETYSKSERMERIKRLQFDLRQERHNADGGGLRAEIAQSHVRTMEDMIRQLRRTKSMQ
jgi:hypothetical protein